MRRGRPRSLPPWHSSGTGALPKHILEPVFKKDGTMDNAEWNRNPTVGVGPFLFKEWQSGSHLIFVANPNYWHGKPKLDQIFIQIVPDDAAQIAAIKAGDSDIGTFISYSVMPDLEKLGTIDLVKAASGYQETWYFNLSTEAKTQGHPALQDVNVRRAIVMAIDREKIVKELLGGRTKVSGTFWEGTPYADPSLKPLGYDPAGAKKLLDEAGWKVGADGIRAKDGVKLKLRYVTTTRDVRKNTQVIVQQMLKDVGIEVELINHASDVFFAGYAEQGPIATGQYDIEQRSTNPAFPDPDFVSWTCKEIPRTRTRPARTTSSSATRSWMTCSRSRPSRWTARPASSCSTDRQDPERQGLLGEHVGRSGLVGRLQEAEERQALGRHAVLERLRVVSRIVS